MHVLRMFSRIKCNAIYCLCSKRRIWKCAEESFDCVGCGICASRCPAGITHYNVGLLARRITGKYIAPESKHLSERVQEIKMENGCWTWWVNE